MRIGLIPKAGRRDIGVLGEISTAVMPSEILNGYFQIFLKTNGIHDVPAVQAESHGNFIVSGRAYHLMKSGIGSAEFLVFSFSVKIVGAAEIILCPSSTNRREFTVSVQEEGLVVMVSDIKNSAAPSQSAAPVLSAPVPPQPPAPATPSAPSPDPRRWSFVDRRTGRRLEVTCMRGCDADHSLDAAEPSDPSDIWCQVDSENVCLPINSNGTPENMRVLSATLNMLPFAESIALRAPHVSVEVVQDEWIEGLDPDGLATVIGTLRERLEHLEQMQGRLEVARAEWRASR